MRVPAAVVPLVKGTTYRRGVYLLLGGVIALPYVLLAATFVRMFADDDAPRPALAVLVAATVAIGAVPPFLGGPVPLRSPRLEPCSVRIYPIRTGATSTGRPGCDRRSGSPATPFSAGLWPWRC